MSTHFTYSETLDKSTLKQGDILKRTENLENLLRHIHPHYTGDEYLYFQVLTQSCDLVLRGSSKQCASRYITLAAVRSLDTVINRAVEDRTESSKRLSISDFVYCSDKHKQSVHQVLESLFNNNDKNHFFLKSCPEQGLLEDSCTFLHLSIAIRASEHYEKCLEAKILELDNNFQAKLGWLVGNLYSRVGTEDFVPGCLESRKEFQEYIKNSLNKHVAWVPADLFATFKKAYEHADEEKSPTLIQEEALKVIEKEKEQRLENFIERLVKTAKVDEEAKGRIRNFLKSPSARNFIK